MKKRGRKRKNERPSLGNLQDTAPELQQDDDANPSPSPTAIVDGGSPVGPLRRSTRRSSSVFARDYDEDYEGEGSGGRRRKEKRLQLVLGSPLDAEEDLLGIDWEDQGQWAAAGSEFEGEDNARNGDCSGGGNGSEKREPNSFRDAGNLFQGEPSDSGRRTPLPDKKLLVLTLDRLQKKDKYKVYSEPVDPDELPDYHEIIENPMDFSTIRNKLSAEAYTCLEEFEKDVFLITSNAMTYNAPSTIYYRQARSIEELAKKCFENIRQGGTDDDLEHKLVRRGRPPGKSSNKKHTGRPPTKHMLDFSDSVPGNTSHSYLWSIPSNAPMENGLALDTPIGASTCFQNLHYSDNTSWLGSHSALRNKQHSVQGNRLAACESDKNVHELSTSHLLHGSHIVTALEGEKQLIPSRLAFITNMHMQEALLDLLLNLGRLVGELLLNGLKRLCPLGQSLGLDGLARKRHLSQIST